MFRRLTLGFIVVLTLVASTAALVAAKADPLPGALQEVRAAVARYHSYEQALADGYSAAGEPCVEEAPGAMGIHAVNLALMPGPGAAIDPFQPQILLYLPRADGSLRLIGVEYFMVALVNTTEGPVPWFSQDDPRAQGLTFFNPAPTLFGETFDGPMPGHNPNMPWHYDLHVWVFEQNPDGVFAMFNPALSCPPG